MNVAFRVDASPDIGVGHLMRCLSLADELRARGLDVLFIFREMPDYLQQWVVHSGHGIASLSGSAPARATREESWPHDQQIRDAGETLDILEKRGGCDMVVVDHYGLGLGWETSLRSLSRLMVIDDLARAHACDILLDQNYYPDMDVRYSNRVAAASRQLLGPGYALLRQDFSRLRGKTLPRNGEVKRIFVLFGGGDPTDLTGRAVAALGTVGRPPRVDVVVGGSHPNRPQLQADCKKLGFECHVQSDRIAELMSAADLALGATGSTSWERCCLGLPAICVSLADNQVPIGRALQEAGACVFLGEEANATVAVIAGAVSALMADGPRLREMSRTAYSMVDGAGCRRVAAVIESQL